MSVMDIFGVFETNRYSVAAYMNVAAFVFRIVKEVIIHLTLLTVNIFIFSQTIGKFVQRT